MAFLVNGVVGGGNLTACSWWRHQMETFSALLAICAGNSPVPGEFPTQRPVTRSFDLFFDLRQNKRLSKQSWGWWLETLSRPLWCHRNVSGRPDKMTHASVTVQTIFGLTPVLNDSLAKDKTCVLTVEMMGCDYNWMRILPDLGETFEPFAQRVKFQ